MRASLIPIVALALACTACGGDDSASGKQHATELSADQPLVPSPDSSPREETSAQTSQDVALAEQQATDTRAQVDMASDVAKAEADHKVQIQKCEGLQDDKRAQCIAAADSALEKVKARETAEFERKQSQM